MPLSADDITPELTEIGAILRARTNYDASGGEAGTFDTETRPTGTEVQAYITDAVNEVLPQLPVDLADNLIPMARRLVALRAAMFIELSYDPERVNQDDSAYARLKELYDEGWAALRAAVDGPRVSGRMTVVTVMSPYGGTAAEEQPELPL